MKKTETAQARRKGGGKRQRWRTMRIDLEEYPLVKMIVFPMTGRKIINTSAGSEAKIIQLEYRED